MLNRPSDNTNVQQVTHHSYVMGSRAFYDKSIIDLWMKQTDLTAHTSPRFWHFYRSNWRMLHIDGFEPGYGNRKIQFGFQMSGSLRPQLKRP